MSCASPWSLQLLVHLVTSPNRLPAVQTESLLELEGDGDQHPHSEDFGPHAVHPQCPPTILCWKILELSLWPCLHLFRGRFKKHYWQVGKGVELSNDLVESKYVNGNDNFLKPSRRLSVSNLLFNQRKPTSSFVLWVQTLVLNNHFSYDFILHLTLTLSYILHRYHKWVTSRRLGKYQ